MDKIIPKRWDIGESIYDAYEHKIDKTTKTHWHSHFLLNIVVEGEGEQVINGKSVFLSEGSVIIISPVDFHKNIVCENSELKVCAVKFSDKLFYDSLVEVCSLSDFPIVTKLSENDLKTAKLLFGLLLEEQQKKLLGSEAFALNIIEQLVILAIRANGKGNDEEKGSGRMKKALVYIHYNFQKPVKAGEVARHVGYSPNYFSAEFKKETGVEFQKYLRDLRLDFAMKLLRLSRLSVTEVCFECGFNTLPHFSSAFKKRFGVSPENFKEDVKK